MGTPEFAVASLEALIAAGHNVVGVVTATDKLGGRGGKQLLQSAVKKAALAHGLPILQPRTLKGKRFLAALRAWEADLQIVVAFRMLPKLVWDMPPLGTINIHGSLLPAYRGAAPIHWAVVNGETETGVTAFFLQHAIDTGDLLLQRSTPIGPDETTGEVYERLMKLGAETLLEAIHLISQGKTTGTPQDEDKVSHAPKIFHDDCKIDWSASAKTCHDFIRGMSPWPAAWTTLDGSELKVLRSAPVKEMDDAGQPAGTLIALPADKTCFGESPSLAVQTGDGLLELLSVKPAGKRAMPGTDFKNGLRAELPLQLGK